MSEAQMPAGFIVRLETRNFSFEAHGLTEEQAIEAMGRLTFQHAAQYGLPTDWADGMDYQTTPFHPGAAWRDDERQF